MTYQHQSLLFAGVRVHCVVLEKQLLPSRPPCGGVVGQGWLVSPCYGGHSIEETPGSIPNPEAKLDCADGTALGRVWESRSPPDIFIGKGGGRRWDARVSVSPSSALPFFHAHFPGRLGRSLAVNPPDDHEPGDSRHRHQLHRASLCPSNVG